MCPDQIDAPGATTPNLIAALQILNPGEIAPPHRHTPAALRFHLEGDGAVTKVNDEPQRMELHDLVLTPSMAWHEHAASDSGHPVIWLDGLDVPMVRSMNAVFFEPEPDGPRPPGVTAVERLRFPWVDQVERRDDLAESDASVLTTVQYHQPDGRPVMPTLGAWSHRLAPDRPVDLPRRTSSQVFVVVDGMLEVSGGGRSHRLERHDVLVIQPWTQVSFTAEQIAASLFSFGDEPALRSLGLYHEETIAGR
jgi:gentisate 1,2-dioxygenase